MLRYCPFVTIIFLKLQIYVHYTETTANGDTNPSHGSNGAASTGIMKMMGLRKSTKPTAMASSEGSGVRCKKIKKMKVSFIKMNTIFSFSIPTS